jgi:hypothetical protein
MVSLRDTLKQLTRPAALDRSTHADENPRSNIGAELTRL